MSDTNEDVVARAKAALDEMTPGFWCAWSDNPFNSLVRELVAALEAVQSLCERWENATELTTGAPSLVTRAFAAEVRSVVGEVTQ